MQHTTHQALILQAADSMPVPQMPMVGQLGVWAAIGYLVVKEVLGYWRGKEAAEDTLVATLVADLRTANNSLLDKLFAMQAQQHQDQAELRVELRALVEQMNKLL